MRILPVRSGLLLAATLAVAACGGSSTPTPVTGVPTVPPVNVPTVPPVNLPTVPPIPSIPALGSFSLPSIPAFGSFSIPSFSTNADPALAALFPTTIGGQPVTAAVTYSFNEFLTFLSQGDPTTAQQESAALTSAGINPTTVTFGSADVTLNGDDITIGAAHTPGSNASNLATVFAQLSQLENPDESPPTVTQGNVGGKSVGKVTTAEGDVTYVYANNDVLWFIDGTTDDTEAGTVLQALP